MLLQHYILGHFLLLLILNPVPLLHNVQFPQELWELECNPSHPDWLRFGLFIIDNMLIIGSMLMAYVLMSVIFCIDLGTMHCPYLALKYSCLVLKRRVWVYFVKSESRCLWRKNSHNRKAKLTQHCNIHCRITICCTSTTEDGFTRVKRNKAAEFLHLWHIC